MEFGCVVIMSVSTASKRPPKIGPCGFAMAAKADGF